MTSFKLLACITLLIGIISCKNNTIDTRDISKTNHNTLPENVALHYGFTNFEKVKTIAFTFNVQKTDKHIIRNWKWNPTTNYVSFFSEEKEINFVHNACESKKEIELDKMFVNDSYWLLFPYHLIWDKQNYSYTVTENILSPLYKNKCTKLTITYLKGDGYTPNDIYELFLNENFEITEWIYRKNASITPTKTTTWEKTIAIDGVKISTYHSGEKGKFKVWFTSINIEN